MFSHHPREGPFPFRVAKFSFDWNAVAFVGEDLLLSRFEFFPITLGFFGRTPHGFTRKSNATRLAVVPVGARPVDGVGVNAFGIVSVALTVALNLPDEISLLVVGVPTEAVESDVAARQMTDGDFGTKLNRGAGFSPHNGTHVGLADADDAVGHLMGPFAIHEFLLAINLMNDKQTLVFVTGQEGELGSIAKLSGDAFEIAPEISQLLADGFADFLPLGFLLFGDC